MSSCTVTVTYSPASDVDRAELERLVDVGTGLRTMTGAAPLYESVRLFDQRPAAVEFVVGFVRDPQYGAENLAIGLVSRALSEAGIHASSGEFIARS